MTHRSAQQSTCFWPRHPFRGTRNPYKDRPFGLEDAFWCQDGKK